MIKVWEVAATAALIVGGASAAAAQNWNGAEQLARGDVAGAERVIVAQQRLFPRDPDLLLNLAVVFARTGRVSEARQAYQQVLAQPNEPLDLDGARLALAHDLATAGLRRLSTEVAAR